jgi:hypothetical protein
MKQVVNGGARSAGQPDGGLVLLRGGRAGHRFLAHDNLVKAMGPGAEGRGAWRQAVAQRRHPDAVAGFWWFQDDPGSPFVASVITMATTLKAEGM